MKISKITSRESLKKLIKKELYDHRLGFPVNKHAALSSKMAEALLLEVFDKAQELVNKPVTTTNERPKCKSCGAITDRVHAAMGVPICIDCSH